MGKYLDLGILAGAAFVGLSLYQRFQSPLEDVAQTVESVVQAFKTGGATTYTHPETGLTQGSTYIKDFFRSLGVVADFGTVDTQMPAVQKENEEIAALGAKLQAATTYRGELEAKIAYQKNLNEMWQMYLNNPIQYVIDYSIPFWDGAQIERAMDSFRSNLETGLGGVAQWENELLKLA